MRLHQLPTEEALAQLGTAATGLAAAEAARRLAAHGPNRVERLRRASLPARLAREFTHLFSAILWVAAGLAFLAEWQAPGEGMARIGIAIVLVIVLSGLFSFWQDWRAEQTLAALQDLLPQRIRALRDGAVAEVPVETIVTGDVVLLEEGDRVPADCRLIAGFGLRVSNATVTGEAMALERTSAPSPEEDPLRAGNVLLAGTAVVSGQGSAVVLATGGDTEFGRIATLTQAGAEAPSPLRRELARLSRTVALLSVSVGLGFLVIGALAGLPFWQDAIFAIGIIVAMVPEGLLATLTVALVLAAQRMARRNVLVRQLTAIEALGSATVICTDKTGTLTENRMRVREVFLGGANHATDAATVARLAASHRDFFLAASLCHDLHRTRAGAAPAGEPMEVALVALARDALPASATPARLGEIPFDPTRMRHSVLHAVDGGALLCCKGAPESILPVCESIAEGGALRPLGEDDRGAILRAHEAMAARGLRVLAFACRHLPAGAADALHEERLVFLGLAGLDDPPRAGVAEAVARCRTAGIRVIMVTGDHPGTACAVARETGLVEGMEPVAIEGDALAALSGEDLARLLDAPGIVFARVRPEEKLRIVEALKAKGHIVAVTGDGVNDAPALRSAHIGIAMGVAGTEVAKQAADLVLLDDNFASIAAAVEEGRAVFENLRRFLTYILVHNVAELVPFLAYALLPIPLALTPLQALFVDMATDSLTALGLGVERPDPRVMQAPPRPRDEPLMTFGVALRGYLFLGTIEAVAGMAAFFHVLTEGGWSWGQILAADDRLYREATTACLAAIVTLQVVNVHLCRDALRSTFAFGLFDNPVIVAGVVLEIVLLLAAVYTPFGHSLLGTAPLAGPVWLFILPFAVSMLLLEEARKWLVRRLRAPRPGAGSGTGG